MKWHWSLLAAAALASPGAAQEVVQQPTAPIVAATTAGEEFVSSMGMGGAPAPPDDGGFLTGDRGFPNFIGFLSNPSFAVDPRALTQLFPIFGNIWSNKLGPVPSGDIQLYGAGLYLALSERLSVGLTRGAFVTSHFEKSRDGITNLGGFVQYTLIRDVPNQFLLTAGLGWEAPTGFAEVGAGHGPPYLAPYLTAGKEFGEFHVLATAGYNFAAGPGTVTTDVFFASLHFDRRLGCWFYPLVEFNGFWHRTNVDPTTLLGQAALFAFDRHDAAGNLIAIAPGFNAVLIKNRLEFGAVYQTDIYSQHNYHFNEVLTKLVLRY